MNKRPSFAVFDDNGADFSRLTQVSQAETLD